MLRRCVVLVLLFVATKGIYDPDDENAIKNTKQFNVHHNYSKVRIQSPIYASPLKKQQEVTQNGDLVRVKRNKTRIEIYSKCPKGVTGQLVFELSCNQYLNCWKGRGFVQNCAPGTLFNPKTLECDYPEKVQCVTGPRQSILLHHYEEFTEETQPGCLEGFSGIIPHYTDCSKFINCDRGRENVMDCPPGTLFDVNSNNCDYPHKAVCVNQQVGGYKRVGGGYEGELFGQNVASGQGQRYRGYNQNVELSHSGILRTSSSQGRHDQNLEAYDQTLESSPTSDLKPHGGQRYQAQYDGSTYKAAPEYYGQAGYNQEAAGAFTSGWQPYGGQRYQAHNVGNTYNAPRDGYRQAGYDQEAAGASTSNLKPHGGQRYQAHTISEASSNDYDQTRYDQKVSGAHRPTHNARTTHQASSNGYGQERYDQNFESYDQNLESSFPDQQNQEYSAGQQNSRRYRLQTNYQGSSGRYRPKFESSATPRYTDTSQDPSFSSYPRGHQINAYRPTPKSEAIQQVVTPTKQNQYEEDPKCPEGGAGLYEHPYDCSKFLNCANGITYIQDCAPGTLFNPILKVCDFPYNVRCGKTENGSRSISTARPNSYRPSSHHQNSNAETVYDQQNRNYGHKPVQNWQGGETRRPSNYQPSQRPQSNIDSYAETVYNQQNRNYEHKPVQNWQDGESSEGHHNYQLQTDIDDESVYNQQNGNYAHKPALNWQEGELSASTGRPNYYRPSNRPETLYDQQNRNYGPKPDQERSTRRPNSYQTSDRSQTDIDSYDQIRNTQQKLWQHWQEASSRRPVNHHSTTNVDSDQEIVYGGSASSSKPPIGFYVTKPPLNPHTPKPEDSPRRNTIYETPEVDYVYEYDDDIIIDAQPAPSNKKPQSVICRSGQYTCPDNQCIPNHALCDGFQDCVSGDDENNCNLNKFGLTRNNKLAVAEKRKIANTTTVACAKYCLDEIAFQCRAFNYRKHDGVCYLLDHNIGLSGALIIYQIFDYYELTAMTIDCTNLFNCPNSKCVPYSKLCDGQDDCGDRTDEKHCSAHVLGYSVRLSGSPKPNEGRIEVTALGKTGFVCDDQFGMQDAEVVCRELGFELGALEVRGNSYYAKEITNNNTLYLMDDVMCVGNESSLRDCDFSGWGVSNCMAQEVVGVVCKTPEEKCKEDFWQCDNERECIPFAFLCEGVYDCSDNSDENDKHCNAPIQLRLANGTTHLEGRVEIKHLGTWGTICDDDFNEDAAKVVCGYFGFHGSASVRKGGYFGAGKGPIWLDQVFCQGNESTVQDCVHWDWGEHNCDHSEDVGVVCSESAYVDGTERHRQQQVVEPPKVEPLQLLPERCGLRKDSIFTADDEVHFRVVKGSEAKFGDYPWQASIRVKGKTKPTHWCGAVIISQRFVLTAAHCLQGFSKSSYIIVAGDYRVDEPEGTEQIALIEDFYLHEDFRKVQKMNNDIALVKLKGNGFSITPDVQPICLPDSDTPYHSDMNCTISGFGSTKTGKAFYSHVLRAGWIPLQSREVCKMPHVYGSSITEGMVCAGFLSEGVDACDGDSGGPLACLYEGVYTLFGLTSWGQHCGYANKPGVYVKVAHYRDWIEEKMRKHA